MKPATPAIQKRQRCRNCERWRVAGDFAGSGFSRICGDCWAKHLECLAVIASGGVPAACHGCGMKLKTLKEREPGDDIRMALHMKDGVYQLLCRNCDSRYVRAQADRFRGTPYGRALNL